MNDKLKEIVNLLWTYDSLREEHILKMCECTEKDINCLIINKAISKDKETNILKYGRRDINIKHIGKFIYADMLLFTKSTEIFSKYVLIHKNTSFAKSPRLRKISGINNPIISKTTFDVILFALIIFYSNKRWLWILK